MRRDRTGRLCDDRPTLRSIGERLTTGDPRIGESPDGGLSWTLSQAVGYEQAMRFLLENRTRRRA